MIATLPTIVERLRAINEAAFYYEPEATLATCQDAANIIERLYERLRAEDRHMTAPSPSTAERLRELMAERKRLMRDGQPNSRVESMIAGHLPALLSRLAVMEEALRFYANPEIYRAHPHGPAFDDRDLSFYARAALNPPSQEE